jgi:hypothetical protein
MDLMSPVDELKESEDALDAEVISKIEELHSAAVVWGQAEHRFGIWGKRGPSTSEAEEAEQAYLAEHGFATYNDFRLRTRHSTLTLALPTPPPPPHWAEHPVGNHSEDLEGPPEPGAVSARGDDWDPALSHDGYAADQLRRRIAPLVAAVQADADRLITLQIEQLELRTAQILSRASEEAAEILHRATQHYDAVLALVEEPLRRTDHLVALTDGISTMIGDAQDEVAALSRALGELAAPSAATGALTTAIA